jgi:hypothetical protein
VATVLHTRDARIYSDDAICAYGGESRQERCGTYRTAGETAQALSYVFYGVGGAAAIAGTALLFSAGAHDREDPAKASPLRTIAWFLVGGGAALAVAGGVATFARESYTSIYNDDSLCVSGQETRYERCSGYRSSAERAQTLALSFLGAGAASATLGIGILIAAPPSSSPAPAAHGSTTCGPMGFGLICQLQF